ncbi:MAG: hypothetical protein F6K17_17105 [Okeania sp. SIO3C4]|nr:hypothetical protein [Okeania sp. SIO3C4]
MRFISGKSKQPPKILTDQTAKRQINKAFVNEDGNKCTRYREVYAKLKAVSLGKRTLQADEGGKCFYCESKPENGAKLEVEHYRPKGAVDKKDTAGVENKGYFWLGNEWSNLLLACSDCNGKSAKGNRFPIAGNRAPAINPVKGDRLYRKKCIATNSPLKDELPLLINPMIDDPSQFFTFDEFGNINAIPDALDRGKTTMEILLLNDKQKRGVLFKSRQNVLNSFIDSMNVLNAYWVKYGRSNLLDNLLNAECRKIKKAQNPEEEFSQFGKAINDNFENWIANRYTDPFKHQLITIYNSI